MNRFWVLLAVLAVVAVVVLVQLDMTADVIDFLAVNWNSRRGG